MLSFFFVDNVVSLHPGFQAASLANFSAFLHDFVGVLSVVAVATLHESQAVIGTVHVAQTVLGFLATSSEIFSLVLNVFFYLYRYSNPIFHDLE